MADSDIAQAARPAQVSGQIILVLRNLLAERYPDLGQHVNTVADLCEQIALEIGFPDEQKMALAQAAFLHDIGKLTLPESILHKRGSLNPDEWRLMRLHTVVGEQILIAAGLGEPVTQVVRSSHERIDGDGYPDGLAGEEIPLGARIIAVCDAFETMTSSRPSRQTPMTPEGALLELMRWSGAQWVTAVVDVTCRLVLDRRASSESVA